MKTITRYVCEFCKTEYADKLKASYCEQSHTNDLTINETKYLGVNNDASPFPIRIKLKDRSTGMTYWYKRMSNQPEEEE